MPRRSKKTPNSTQKVVKPNWRWFWLFGLLALWLVCTGATPFYPLSHRLAQYPDWVTKPPVEAASGDLVYPDWFEGEWTVNTTLVDLTAPLAPDVVTPGFESNQAYLNQPVTFQARFMRQPSSDSGVGWGRSLRFPFQTLISEPSAGSNSSLHAEPIIADRAFNGLNLTRTYLNQTTAGLGDRLVLNVKVDPQNPNRHITLMRGDRQLVSTVTGRLTEAPDADQFITTELFQQVFRGIPQPYLNEVETTTRYRYQQGNALTSSPDAFARNSSETRSANSLGGRPKITADQVTAIYLSAQDPDYFKAGDRPVALYRYRLDFTPAQESAQNGVSMRAFGPH